MKILLLGYMGSGKSSIGVELAQALGYTFIDLDHFIEEHEQRSIVDIFKIHSEIYFRKIETKYLKMVLDRSEHVVLSLGGGTPCYAQNLPLIHGYVNTKTVYLETSITTLTQRLSSEKERRPLLAHLETNLALNDFIRKHLFERSYYYNQATFVVKTDEKSVQEIVENIIARLL